MIHLPENYHKVYDELYEQRLKKPIATVNLPCADRHKYKEPVLVEIHEARDQAITCPMCGKKSYLVWSKIQNNLHWSK